MPPPRSARSGEGFDIDFGLSLREAREQFERAYLLRQLQETGGSVGKLAKLVGMERTHLYRKLRDLGVDVKARVRARIDTSLQGEGVRMSEEPTIADSVGTAAEEPLPAEIGPYRILGLLGEGAMGRVYLARESQPPRDVALKVMRALGRSALTRFRREVELLAQLEHPGIARLYAASDPADEQRAPPWLALEYVRGHDLIAHARLGELGLDARLQLLIDVCRAVHYAHGRGVIHRDLKPGNILVDESGQPKVLDFGIARLADGLSREVTQLGQVLGTVPYMSPEQLSGNSAQVDVRSDVYALGCIAYELIGGRLPHPQLSVSTLFEAIDIVRRQTPLPLGRLEAAADGDLETVVMKALASEPEQRYSSAAELAADLQRVREHRPIDARPPTMRYLLARFVRRHRFASAAAAVGLVALIASSIVSMRLAWAEAAARREAEIRAAEAGAVNGFLERMLVSADPERMQGGDLTVRSVLDAAQAELPQAGLAPLAAARVNLTLATSLLKLGEAARAQTLFAQALTTLDDSAPIELRDALQVGEARALYAQQKYAEADALIEPLLARTSPAPKPAIRIDAELAQAEGLLAQGKSEAAEQRLRPLLRDAQRELGDSHALTLAVSQNLGSTLRLAGRYDEAIELARVARGASGESRYGSSAHDESAQPARRVVRAQERRCRGRYRVREVIAARTRCSARRIPKPSTRSRRSRHFSCVAVNPNRASR